MKVLVVVSCLLAAASAGLLAPLAYHAPHVPVLDHNGYQIDTADVQLAKAAHFAAHGEALGRLGHVAVAAPIAHAVAAPVLAAPLAYAGPIHIPTIGPNGVPLDTPEVAAGKAANAAAHIEAKARNGDLAVVAPVAHAYAAPLHYAAAAPVVNGVPLDTPEVAHAKAAHFAAHIEAKARNGVIHPLLHYRKRRGILGAYAAPIAAPLAYTTGYYGPQNIPVIGPNGVPLETPEVVAAKIGHAAAHVEAKARNGELAVVAPYAAPLAAGIAAPITTYAAGYAAPLAYAAPQHIPVIGPNGVPLDEPAVAAAKINHAAAHVEAQARNGDYAVVAPVAHAYAAPLAHAVSPLAHAVSPLAYTTGYLGPQNIPVIGPNGVPLDTPEVAAGKAANAAAHIEAKVRNGDLALHY